MSLHAEVAFPRDAPVVTPAGRPQRRPNGVDWLVVRRQEGDLLLPSTVSARWPSGGARAPSDLVSAPPRLNQEVEVRSGVRAEEAAEQLRAFSAARRDRYP